MALAFDGSVGSLFSRLASLGKVIDKLQSYQSGQLTNLTSATTGIVAQLLGESDILATVGQNYISSLNGPDSIGNLMQQMAEAIINRQVYRDNPQLNQTLTSSNTLTSILEVIRQMKLQHATVLAMTVTGTPTAFTGAGNGVIVFSSKRPQDGKTTELAYTENALIACTADSYTGGTQAFNESFSISGVGSQPDWFAFDWPLGSNASISLSAIDGDTSNGAGNLLTNSNWATWGQFLLSGSGGSASYTLPSNWLIDTGAGTIAQETGIVFGNGSSLKLTGDGTTQTQIRQQFGISGGTPATLSPLTQYSFNLFIRRDGTAADAGVLTVDLEDVNGNIIKDANGVANSFTIDLTALTTSFVAYNLTIRTPIILPSTIYLRLQNSTALTNGRAVYIAKMSLGAMTRHYLSGPWYAIHAGSVPWIAADYATCQVTNSRGAAGTLLTWQTVFSQLLPSFVYNNEILLPSAASPSIADSLL